MLSIIIPTFNEADQIAITIGRIHATHPKQEFEIIVADAGSNDGTVEIVKQAGAGVVDSTRKGRGAQMNEGAAVAKYELLYFLHADSIPPHNFTTQILDAYHKGISSGCFRLKFDSKHWFLQGNAWFTRFDVNAVRFGDQSLFVSKSVFKKGEAIKKTC